VIEKITKTVYRCTCELEGCSGVEPGTEKHIPWNSNDPNPDRCRWCLRRTWNGQDLRLRHLITANGKTRRISEWATSTGMSAKTIRARLKAGWSEEEAVNLPPGTIRKRGKTR